MPRFVALDDEIRRGVELCQESCRYFPFCGGGPPGNKFFENGDFATTETLSCRLHKKATFDVALDKLFQWALDEDLEESAVRAAHPALESRRHAATRQVVGACMRASDIGHRRPLAFPGRA